MKNVKLIFTLLLIASLMIVSSCGKKAEEEPKSLVEEKSTEIEKEETVIPEPEQPAVVEEVKKKEVKPEKPVDTGAKVFEVQVLSLTDRYSVELQQEAMLKKGVRTYISEYIKDGEKYYRLRLEGKYSRHGAEEIGEKVKRDFWGIIDYWIVKTG